MRLLLRPEKAGSALASELGLEFRWELAPDGPSFVPSSTDDGCGEWHLPMTDEMWDVWNRMRDELEGVDRSET